jgi:hypothetical protein
MDSLFLLSLKQQSVIATTARNKCHPKLKVGKKNESREKSRRRKK